MKNLIVLIIISFFFLNLTFSQGVAINTDGSQAASDAVLHLKSTSQGLIVPSMTSTQRTSISNVSNGLLVYDTQTNSFWYRDSGTWQELVTADNIDITSIEDTDGDTKIQVEEGNDDDIVRFDINGGERLRLSRNANGIFMMEIPSNGGNTFLGQNAGENTGSNGDNNCFFGLNAGLNNVDAESCVFTGNNAGASITEGNNNIFIGSFAGNDMTGGFFNTFLGGNAGVHRVSGDRNTFLGFQAGHTGSSSNAYSGSRNVFIGFQAGYNADVSDQLYIDNSPTSSPLIFGNFSTNELQCNGSFYVNTLSTTNTNPSLYFKNNGTNRFSMGYNESSDYFFIKDEVNDDQILYINDGKVGINRVSPSNDFEVNGTASKSSAGDWLANSDARLKKNIKSLAAEATLQRLLELQGVSYEWDDQKTDIERPEGIQYGFTAQNVQAVFPELVSEDNMGYLQTAYGTYDAMYIESIRALLGRINELESELDQLKYLEARLSKLEAANGLSTSK